jgi:hypothetical protein
LIDLSSTGKDLEVIASIDPAIDVDRDTYEDYLKNLDETKLTFVEGVTPSRFVMKKFLNWNEQSEVNEAKMAQSGRRSKMNLHYITEHVRRALVDIKNPGPGCEFVKDKDGKASKELVAKLDSAGIVADLYSALQEHLANKSGSVDLKKN